MTTALNSPKGSARIWAPPAGEVTTLVAVDSTGATWPAGTRILVGASSDLLAAGHELGTVSIATSTATWALSEADCDDLRAHTRFVLQVPSGASYDGVLAGPIILEGAWSGSHSIQTIGTVAVGPRGPEGPTAVSADAGNAATLGTDSLLFVPAVPTEDIEGAVIDYLTANPPAAAVDSVNGQTGAVTLDAADVGADPAGTAAGLVGALAIPDSPDDIGAASAAHSHVLADITDYAAPDLSGYVTTTDPRLTDARTPTAHTHSAADVDSETATDGFVLTADGLGGAAWEAVPAGGSPALDDLSDVATTGAAAGEALVYTVGGWEPSSAAVVLEGDARLTDARTPTSHTHTASQISDSTTTGRSLITAAGAVAARTAISAAPALGTDDNYVTDAEKVKLSNLSGTNTGDQDLSGYALSTQAINAQTGTTYELVASDAGELVTCTNSGAITVTVPASTFSAGQRVDMAQRGDGAVTLVGSGITVNPPTGLSLVSKGNKSYWTVLFISATEADVIGMMATP
jgi:hypothetical protein